MHAPTGSAQTPLGLYLQNLGRSRDAPGRGDPTRPTPFSQARHTLLDRAPGADRGYHVGRGRPADPNYRPWPEQIDPTRRA